MFFKQQSIEKHLVCKACELMFDDPRVLPCGHSFCSDCITSRLNKKTNNVECPICKTNHVHQSNGFLVNKVIIELLGEKAEEVSQWQKVKDLRQKLEMVDSKSTSLAKSLRAGDSEVKEYCQTLKTKVDLNMEVKIEEIRRICQEFKNEIDNYEKECSKSYSAVSDSGKQELDSFLAKMKEFYSSSRDILNQYELKDSEVEQLVEQSNQNLCSIDAKERILERTKFNSKLLLFESPESKLSSSDVGFLRYKTLASPLKTGPISKISLPIKNSGKKNCVEMVYSTSTQCFYTVFEENSLFEVAVFSITGQANARHFSIGLRCNNTARYYGSFLCLPETKSGFILGISTAKRPPNEIGNYAFSYDSLHVQGKVCNVNSGSKTMFIHLNQDFCYITNVPLTEKCSLCAVNSTSIFGLNDTKVVICPVIRSSFHTSINFAENIPAGVKAMQANEVNLFILYTDSHKSKLRVFNISNKSIQRDIEVGSLSFDQFKLHSTKYLILFDCQSNSLCVYDQNKIKDCINELQLPFSLQNNLQLVKGDSNAVYFFNNQGEIIDPLIKIN